MRYLDQALEAYGKSDVYPFHMPGHKRNPLPFPEVYGIDITEIDGFDNLHHAEGILKEAQQRAADLYGSAHCYYLVNGSTCGILASICAAVKKRGRILAARNSHKAVYHALFFIGTDCRISLSDGDRMWDSGTDHTTAGGGCTKKRSGDLGSRDHIADV